MPEGPEVKRCSEVLRDTIQGKRLAEVRLVSGKLSREGIENLDKLTYGNNIPHVTARGKSIFIEMQGEYSMVSTLGMSGWWYPNLETVSKEQLGEAYYARVINTIEKALKHTRLQLVMDDGSVANYIDPRNFGNFYVVSQSEIQKRRQALGIDYLNAHPGIIWNQLGYIFSKPEKLTRLGDSKMLSKKYLKMPIGELLLDQSIVAGLGNIYRAETMYLAGINPMATGPDLTQHQLGLLEEAAEYVLTTAYEGRGSMLYKVDDLQYFLPEIKDLRKHDVNWASAVAIKRHMVYGYSHDIFGNRIVTDKIGGRTCWWCPQIQDYWAMEKRKDLVGCK